MRNVECGMRNAEGHSTLNSDSRQQAILHVAGRITGCLRILEITADAVDVFSAGEQRFFVPPVAANLLQADIG